MIRLRTELPLPSYPFSIDHRTRVLAIGSCFAVHIGQRLEAGKFPCRTNPFGTLYNPVSIARNLERALTGAPPPPPELFENNGSWYSFQHPTRFTGFTRADLQEELHRTSQSVQHYLQETDVLLLTLGSSLVYHHHTYGDIVANCHKLPAAQFTRRRLRIEEVTKVLGDVFSRLREIRPALRILLTVSPVRHGREGLIENQRSKAVLLLAAEELQRQNEDVFYFPAYELLLDDLRDYRFYESDLLHPNQLAVDYIWEYFAKAFFREDTRQLNRELAKLRSAIHHRAFRPEAAEHQNFLRQQLERIDRLEQKHPYLSFVEERAAFRSGLISKPDA